jgi:hypothetical protein
MTTVAISADISAPFEKASGKSVKGRPELEKQNKSSQRTRPY